MLDSSRGFRLSVAMKCLLLVLLAFYGRTSGLPVGSPDVATGSSVDGSVYAHRDEEGIHGGEDGASKYLLMGQDPKPAGVDGSPFLETKVKVLDSSVEVYPKPASPGVAGQRKLLWFGFGGGGDKDEKDKQNDEGEKVLQEGLKQEENLTEEKARMDGEGKQGVGEEEDDDLDDTDHMWHDDDHIDTDEDDGDLAVDEDEDEEMDNYEDDDDHHDNGIIYTHGKIMKVAMNLLNEYQLKSLNIKEEVTDVKEREKAVERLESDIDTEVDLLMEKARTADDENNGAVKKQEFLERMVDAKKAAKKRVKDILTGHNVHFDKDNL